ncbi:MAG: MoaD/ThiS family protein [Chloroflexi bacterium]|nr:MoaD/ThiS family protein [Chloroflexota bacterium]
MKAYGLLKSLTGELPGALDISGNTLGDLVSFLGRKYGQKVKDELLDEKGELDFSYAFFVSGERRSNKNAELKEGDEIVITNMLGGGESPG